MQLARLLFLGLLCLPFEALASTEGLVVSVPDSRHLVLDTGERVRLLGIEPPEEETTSPSLDAKIKKLVMGHRVKAEGEERDRDGALLATVFLVPPSEERRSLQERVISEGAAFVMPRIEARAVLQAMLSAEERARQGRKGMWSLPAYRLDHPTRLESGHYVFVTGQVVSCDNQDDGLALSMAVSETQTITVILSPDVRRYLKEERLDPRRWMGEWIRVRGYLQIGTVIKVKEAEQITPDCSLFKNKRIRPNLFCASVAPAFAEED